MKMRPLRFSLIAGASAISAQGVGGIILDMGLLDLDTPASGLPGGGLRVPKNVAVL